MNCVETFFRHSREAPNRCALWLPSGLQVSFGDLQDQARRIQMELLSLGLKPGDPAILFLDLSSELYASVIALLALGCPILLVEPWLSVEKIETFVQSVAPRAFITSSLGKLWALRIPALRRIAITFDPAGALSSHSQKSFHLESVEASHLGILTFTSGTSGGIPKGVVRTHGYLLEQLQIFSRRLQPSSVDWCIFANFAIANLALGITSIITDRGWSSSILKKIAQLPGDLKPRSLTCGPAFLEKILSLGGDYSSLHSIHVGGALTDCSVFEHAFRALPETHFTHVYGSTEAEPVALMDAREAVRLSRQAGSTQTLVVGRPIPEIRTLTDSSGLWVSGPHVCPRYWGDTPENKTHKRIDPQGGSWHCMGDRVRADPEGRLWYRGRAFQAESDFEAEQRSYSILGHTRAFVHRDLLNRAWFLGEGAVGNEKKLRAALPFLYGIEDVKVFRDARHHARIDRKKTIIKGAPWLNSRAG
jgi:acyl-coenzyme A synthetase/AMP-(fatty) acid ligase